ncbi:MAG: hypothetical protein HOP19_01545 [Acidobacteria bacterium]|nr:hypothetical protein [Acidobacteriota bacterium]
MAEQLPYICGRHSAPLSAVMAGGAGWCASCHAFVQSANHPMPTISPELIAKREAGRAALKKQRARESARKRKAALIEGEATQ